MSQESQTEKREIGYSTAREGAVI